MKTSLAIGGLLAAFSVSTATAMTTTLDFTSGGTVDAEIDANTYGDNAFADLSYRAIDPGAYGNVGTTGGLSAWGSGYGDLDGALWGEPNPSHGEIRIEALNPAETVTIESFDMGGWSADEAARWFIYDLSWNVIGSGSGIAPNTGGRLSFAPGVGAMGGVIFQWGEDAWDVGVENFTYSVTGAPTVPLPASAFLLIGGLGALAAFRKRR